jgi:hypothetical protein
MATPVCFPITQIGNNTTASGTTISVAATSVSTPIVIGNNVLFRIVATTPINVRFGPTGLNTASANDVYIPAGVIDIHDMGANLNTIVIYNPGASAVSVNVSILSRT